MHEAEEFVKKNLPFGIVVDLVKLKPEKKEKNYKYDRSINRNDC